MAPLPNTIPDIARAARARLAPHIFDYLSGGSGREMALRRNEAFLDSLHIVPRVLRDVSRVDTRTAFLNRQIGMPALMAPIGSLGLFDRDGAAAVAAAAAGHSVPVAMSVMATPTLEETAARRGTVPLMLQIYMRGDRTWLVDTIRRARENGFAGLCVTVDTPVYSRRDRDISNGFSSSAAIDRPNLPDRQDQQITSEQAQLTWDDLAWLRENCDLPLVVKGILDVGDALRAARLGCDAIYLSNHGGRQLDCAVSAVERLPVVRAAVGPDLPLVVDGGVRSGSDILKALALGASVVGIGKMQAMALSVGGCEGVSRLLEILSAELQAAMALSGITQITATRELEVISTLAVPVPLTAACSHPWLPNQRPDHPSSHESAI